MKDNTLTDTACVISTAFILYVLLFAPSVNAYEGHESPYTLWWVTNYQATKIITYKNKLTCRKELVSLAKGSMSNRTKLGEFVCIAGNNL